MFWMMSKLDVPWLDKSVPLPGGYRTSRRDTLKVLSLGMGLSSIGVLLTRAKRDPSIRPWLRKMAYVVQIGIFWYLYRVYKYLGKAMSFASPKALLTALFPREDISRAVPTGADRVAAFKRYIGSVEARGPESVPEFPAGADWLNAPPLALGRELRGRVLVLDFWTYCCINCMHVLPQLAALEDKYGDAPVTVVGVHSAKFDNEKVSDAIRDAVLRYEITHPVVNDADMSLWRALGISSWPTLAVVSPGGKLLTVLAGENHQQDIDDFVAAALEYYGELGVLDNTPVPQALEREKDARLLRSPLRFPGKLAVDNANGVLFVSDSNNHRVVASTLDGAFLYEIGGAGCGLVDGAWDKCAFNRPQGVAFDEQRNCLFIADTENHAVRVANLTTKTVKTLAGNGVKGADYAGGLSGGAQQLNSPWDVALTADGGTLVIAMAGQHQIWKMDPDTGACASFSGTGFERNQNGSSGLNTAWAQPSGLALSPDGSSMYVADSESSSLRVVDVQTGGGKLLAGGDALLSDNLFLFGDRDGSARQALLQHPLGVAVAPDGSVYITDSYNHKIKRYNPATQSMTTVAGSGTAGFRDGQGSTAALSEPSDVVVLPSGDLLVADTNNCVVRRVSQEGSVSTLDIRGVPSPRSTKPVGAALAAAPPPGAVFIQADAVAARNGTVQVDITLPEGYHLTKGAGSGWTAAPVSGQPDAFSVAPASGVFREDSDTLRAQIGFEGLSDSAETVLRILARVYFCKEDDVCLLEEVAVNVPLSSASSLSGKQIVVNHGVAVKGQ